MQDVVIVAAGRTAIGAFGKSLSKLPAHNLGAIVVKELLQQVDLNPAEIDEVILGQVLTAGQGQNPARQTALAAGLPETVPALTINKVCGSGLKSVQMAAQAIRCGDADLIIAGGQENMSLSPHLLPNGRTGQRMGDMTLVDSMVKDGLWDVFNDYHMGITAENLAEKYAISREAQDAFSAQSQQRTETAIKKGRFAEEIIPVTLPQRKGDPLIFSQDEFPRTGVTTDALSSLKPAFKAQGTVTAGNASGINDGAAIILVASRKKANELKLPILATIKAYANAGVDPAVMGIGPVPATKRCLENAKWHLNEIDLIEANEAFAAQALAVAKELELDMEKVNVNGGAIALGHPIGASGARILVTLLHEMKRRQATKGLATLCIGGGQGTAIAIEREN